MVQSPCLCPLRGWDWEDFYKFFEARWFNSPRFLFDSLNCGFMQIALIGWCPLRSQSGMPTYPTLRFSTCGLPLALYRKFLYNMTYNSEEQGLSLVRLRKNAKLTQRQAANRLGIRESTISDWERGVSAPSVLWVPKIADCYKCSYAQVVAAFLASNNNLPEEIHENN